MTETATLPETVAIRHLSRCVDQEVRLLGWLENKRSSGKIAFLQVRDGSGSVQAVVSRKAVSEEEWAVSTLSPRFGVWFSCQPPNTRGGSCR